MSRKPISDKAFAKATGKPRKDWFFIIDKEGGPKLSHKEIARLLFKKYGVSGWWAQSITVEYEYAKNRRIVGETAQAGFEIGVSQTLPVSSEKVWDFMTGKGLKIWLGDIPSLKLAKGAKFKTAEGTTVEIRSYEAGRKLRLTWQPKSWEKPSIVQIYLLPSGNKTSIRFHQEKLAGLKEREAMRRRWKKALGKMGSLLA